MSNFDKLYKPLDGNKLSPSLKPLLELFYNELVNKQRNLPAIKESMIALLSFLTTPEGRTDANCRAVDYFICFDDDWERDWAGLPESFIDIIADMGGALHDTISYPHIAEMVDSTPEQLLKRAKEIKIE